MKKSPLALVVDQFGSKAALAEKLIPRLMKPADESDADFAKRMGTASNKQLLRLWNAEERVTKDFGSREALIDTIVTQKFVNGDAGYKAKLSQYANTRLLDMAR